MALLLVGAAALVIAFWLVLRLRSLLVMLLISFVLSFAIEPPVNLLASHGWRRGLGTGVVFAGNDRLGTELSGAELSDQLRSNPGVKDFVNGLAAGAVGLSTTLVGLVLQGPTIGLFTCEVAADPLTSTPYPARRAQ